MRKIKRDGHAPDAFLAQHSGKDVGHPWALQAFATKFLLVRAEWEDVATPSLFAGSINLQIAHHDIPAIPNIEMDERVGHEHADSIEHVRVIVAGGDQQHGLRFLHDLQFSFCVDN